MKDIKVAIPLKTNSIRVPNKNLRQFVNEDSLFDVKIKQLLKTIKPEDIYVSSEDIRVKDLTDKYGLNFLHRDLSLTPNSAPWTDVTKDIVTKIPGDSDIMWVQVTQPLFDEFDKVLDTWNKVQDQHDSLVVVKQIKHHILDSNGGPVNFNFGYWHKISQELPDFYQLTWACFCLKREMLEKTWYQIGRTPYLYNTEAPLVDIDTMEEFELASLLYKYYK